MKMDPVCDVLFQQRVLTTISELEKAHESRGALPLETYCFRVSYDRGQTRRMGC